MDNQPRHAISDIDAGELLRKLSANSKLTLFVLECGADARWRFTHLGQNLLDALGIPAHDAAEDAGCIFKLIPAHDHRDFHETLQQARRTGQFWRCDFRLALRDGEVRPYTVTGEVRATASGDVVVSGHILDCSNDGPTLRGATVPSPASRAMSGNTEETLLLQALTMDSATFGILITDATEKHHPIIYANRAFCAMTGYTLAEILHRNSAILHGQDVTQDGVQEIRAALRKGSSITTTLRNYRKDGSPFSNRVTINPLRNTSGMVTHFAATVNDISSELAAFAELTANAARFRILAEHAPIGIYLWRPGSGVEYVNEQFSAITSLDYEQALESDWGAAIHPDDREIAIKNWLEAAATGMPSHNEFRFLRQGGQTVWIASMSVPLYDEDGELSGRIGTFVDRTEQKVGEQALGEAKNEADTANQVKSLFLARTSHELRTPLNAVLGLSQVLTMAGNLPAEHQQNAHEIYRSSGHLLRLIEDLLDLSKIQAGEISLTSETVDLLHLVEEVATTFRQSAEECGVEIRLEFKHPAARFAIGDYVRINEVISNLVSNALKYAASGGRVVLSSETEADTVRIDVRDFGPGLPADQTRTVFEPFERLGKEVSGIEGSGIGLTICRDLAQAMGGRLGVESNGDQGTRFWLELPATTPPGPEQIASVGPQHHAVPVTESNAPSLSAFGRVLVTEDNRGNQRLFEQLLKLWDIAIDVADDGEQAEQQWRDGSYRLLLTDLQMPNVDGIELTRRIRAAERDGDERLYIIGISAHAMELEKNRCLESGMDDYITKPIDLARLKLALEKGAATMTGAPRS